MGDIEEFFKTRELELTRKIIEKIERYVEKYLDSNQGFCYEMAVKATQRKQAEQFYKVTLSLENDDTAPRLSGMWTGEWNPVYTMDTNVNIQAAAMNTGNIFEAGVGYINFVLRQIPDWEENARMVCGMTGAVLTPVNTDGDRACMVEYDKSYSFQYWNAGTSWLQ